MKAILMKVGGPWARFTCGNVECKSVFSVRRPVPDMVKCPICEEVQTFLGHDAVHDAALKPEKEIDEISNKFKGIEPMLGEKDAGMPINERLAFVLSAGEDYIDALDDIETAIISIRDKIRRK